MPLEKQDQLSRSNKKPKRKITHLIFNQDNPPDNASMEFEVQEPLQPRIPPVAAPESETRGLFPPAHAQPPKSFRDLIRDTQLANALEQELVNDIDDEDISDDDVGPEDLTDTDRCPIILLSKEEKRAIRKPWKNTLIIRMFDGSLGYMGLMKRLKRKWQLKGDFSLTDIGCKYFIARFNNMDDLNYVLTQGPWLIDDSYLTIRKWTPNFIPEEASIKVLTTWVRIPNLSVEYFDKEFLKKIGSKIGKVIRVDKSTAYAERGQFTRLSVEIDLAKPLLSKFWLKGKIWRIQYEGIKMVCYKCGKLGHAEEKCPPPKDNDPMVVEQFDDQLPAVQPSNQNRILKPEQTTDYGSWMLVKRGVRKRPPRTEKQAAPTTNEGLQRGSPGNAQIPPAPNPTSNIQEKGNLINGSRFEALSQASVEENLVSNAVDLAVVNSRDFIADNNGNSLTDSVVSLGTIDLGENSQKPPRIIKDIQKFNLGSKDSQRKKSVAATPKSKPALRGNSLAKPLQPISNARTNKEKRPLITVYPTPGKENSSNSTTATRGTTNEPKVANFINDPPSQVLPTTTSHVSPTIECNQPEYTFGKDPVCRTSNGDALSGHSKPPDTHLGSTHRDLDGTSSRAPGVDNDSAAPE